MNEKRLEQIALEIFSDPDPRFERLHVRAVAALRRAVKEALEDAAELADKNEGMTPYEYAREIRYLKP